MKWQSLRRRVDLPESPERSRPRNRFREAGVRAGDPGHPGNLLHDAEWHDRRPGLVAASLHGTFGYGSPMQVRFPGRGLVKGEEWVYDYLGWLVPVWPGSNDQLQRAAIVGSVVRTVPHSSNGGVAPAGVVASFYAVRQP